MQHTDINALMATIIGKLMPVSAKDANPELWWIYDALQSWAVQIEHRTPIMLDETPEEIAYDILNHTRRLQDKTLATAIQQVVTQHTHFPLSA